MNLMPYRPIQSIPLDRRLGRFIPDTWEHIAKYPFSVSRSSFSDNVEKTLKLPYWHKTHDQGREGSCVGHGVAMERAITNTSQNFMMNIAGWKTRRYDPINIWSGAKTIDEWEETKAGDDNGTSVNAGYQWIFTKGLLRVKNILLDPDGMPMPVGADYYRIDDSVLSYKWATEVDQIRAAIALGIPVTIGINWYRSFSNPVFMPPTKQYFIGIGELGPIEGGHCVCIYGASDRRQAFKIKNSWGSNYPLVWMPYSTMQRMLDEYGEAALVTDK